MAQMVPLGVVLLLLAALEWFAWEVSEGAELRVRVTVEIAIAIVFTTLVLAPFIVNWPR